MMSYGKVSLLLLSGFAFSACGGGGSSTSTPPPTNSGGSSTPPMVSTPEPTVIQDVEYTQAATRTGDKSLFLDIYQPDVNCEANRPTVLYVHGGGFIAGNKSSDVITQLAEATTDKGFNFVSIQYRLFNDGPVLSPTYRAIVDEFSSLISPAEQVLIDAAVAATEDTVTALNWMEDNASEYCLDTTNLAYWGSSAGAITVLQVGYGLNQYGIERPEPKVVIDYWGNLFRDSDLEFREAPLFILHGDADDVVPYQGALELQMRAEAVDVPYAFYTVAGAGHAYDAIDIFELQSGGTTLIDQTVNFIEAHVVGGLPDYTTVTITP